MLNKRLLVVATLMLSMVSGAAWAAAPKRAIEIMNQVRVVDGFINEQLHTEFWVDIKKSVQPDPDGSKLKEMEKELKEITITNSAFPLEGWRSARLSLQKRKVVKTPELVRLIAKIKAMNVPGYAKPIASTDELLVAAATGKPLTRDGRTVYINKEMIDQVLDGMDASTSRLVMLTNPVWSTEMHEQVIPGMQLTVLTQDRFAISTLNDQSKKGRVASRNNGVIQEQIVHVQFDSNLNLDLSKAARGSCDGALGSVGIECKPLPTQWRGLDGLNAVVPVTMGGKTHGMAIMTVQLPKERAILTFMTMTDGSPADAGIALDELLKRVKLNK
jgi:hypothetical protein